MPHSYILTIDLGTSGPKVALFTVEGQAIGSAFATTAYQLLPNGGAEQNPDDWWGAIRKAMQKLLAQQSIDKTRIEAISVTSQWSGTVAVDKHGKHLHPAIIWMDSRGAAQIDKITDGLIKVEGYALNKIIHWLRKTGGVPTKSGKDPIAHILYLKEHFPKIYEQTHLFLEPKDYLNYKLTGEFVSTYETMVLHWVTDNRDIENIHYSDKLLQLAGIDKEKLPRMKAASDIIGQLSTQAAADLDLPKGIWVIGGTPDVHSAAIGSGAIKNYQAHLYIGTSSWLGAFVPFKKTDIFHNMASLPSALPGKYLITNEQETAGECVNFLRDQIFFPDDVLQTKAPKDYYSLINQLAELSEEGSNGLVFTPWLFGERSPIEDHTIRGGFHNLSLQNNRNDMYRAVFEGVAYNSRWLLKYVEQIAGRTFDFVNFIGGGAQSDLWCQIQANVLDREIRQVADPILANSRGAAFLASIALNYLTIDDVDKQTKISNIYTPNQAHRSLHDTRFDEYQQIYKQNRKIHKRLNSSK